MKKEEGVTREKRGWRKKRTRNTSNDEMRKSEEGAGQEKGRDER